MKKGTLIKQARIIVQVGQDAHIVLAGEFVGCHPCINTTSIKLKTEDMFGPLLKAVHHDMKIVELVGE